MSVHNKLQKMMSSDEYGKFLTKEERLINEGFFSVLGNIGTDFGTLLRGTTKTLMKITSTIGKDIQATINKIDIEKFKQEQGIKDIKDLDLKLSTMKVNNPEFFALMKSLMLVSAKSKKTNKELFDAVSPIFDRHMQRMIDYYETLLRSTKDETQAVMYYGILIDMIGWLDKERHQHLWDDIMRALSDYKDRVSKRKELSDPELKKPPTKEDNAFVEKHLEGDSDNISAAEITAAKLRTFSDEELASYIRLANEYIEDSKNGNWMTKKSPETGLPVADMDEVENQMRVVDNLKLASDMLSGKVKRGEQPKKPAARPVQRKPEKQPTAAEIGKEPPAPEANK